MVKAMALFDTARYSTSNLSEIPPQTGDPQPSPPWALPIHGSPKSSHIDFGVC